MGPQWPAVLCLAQDPFPGAGTDPAGVLVDARGKPIVGALVALRCAFDRQRPSRSPIVPPGGRAYRLNSTARKRSRLTMPVVAVVDWSAAIHTKGRGTGAVGIVNDIPLLTETGMPGRVESSPAACA